VIQRRNAGYTSGRKPPVTAEFRRAQIERRFAGKKLEIAIERFEVNPGKSDIVQFLNEHGSE
jgi:hypothetical protein